MKKAVNLSDIDSVDATEAWLSAFGTYLDEQDVQSAANLFIADGQWRDLLAFTWHIQSMSGGAEIASTLRDSLARTQPTGFRIAEGRTPPRNISRAGVDCIESFIEFDTKSGPANGILRLIPNQYTPTKTKAWILMTAIEAISGFEETVGNNRPTGENYSRTFGDENWLDLRKRSRAYEDREPTVLVIGAGQSGLTIAARLGVLGVDTLIIDKHERIGDNWRKRYHSLTLHNEVYVNHLPYMPFPPNWPVFIPKDKLANWFEAYAESMELNVWVGTELKNGSYDDKTSQWIITLKRKDGSEREVKPRHVVFATGVSSIPVLPEIPGLQDFEGTVMHSGSYIDGHNWKGKKALVLGTGNSGHDVAQDLHACGASASIIQRSSTYIVSLKEAQKVYAHYFEGPPIEDNDLLAVSFPYQVLIKSYQIATNSMRENDKELLNGLEDRGFRLNYGGHDDTGFQMSYLRRGGGYCFNVGCSELIINGEVGLIQFSDIDSFVNTGAKMKDGSIIEADLLVTATGYKNQQDTVRHYLGDQIANKIGPVWGFDQGGELRNMWRRTPQPGLWFTAGGLAQIRIYSKFLALQIKAIEEGLLQPTMIEPGARPISEAAD